MSRLPTDRGWIRFAVPFAVMLAIAVRAGAAFGVHGSFDDPDNYLPLASSLAHGEGLSWNGRPTAYRPPLYPILLAPLVKFGDERPLLGIALLHLALGAATVALTARTAQRWELCEVRVAAAALIVACDPVLVWQSRFVMTETLGAFLVALALFEVAHPGLPGSLKGGVCLGLAALCRPSLLAGRHARRRGGPARGRGNPTPAVLARADDGSRDDGRARSVGRAKRADRWGSPSGRPLTAATPWPWGITRPITARSWTARRARSGTEETSGPGGIQ